MDWRASPESTASNSWARRSAKGARRERRLVEGFALSDYLRSAFTSALSIAMRMNRW